MMAWTPEQFPRLPTRVEMVERSVERQERQLEDVVTWTRRTAISAAVLTIGGLGSLALLLIDKLL